MGYATKALSEYVKQKGIQISVLANTTGIPYGKLWDSLSVNGTRELRADEFLSICSFVEKNPMEFADNQNEKEAC